MYTLSKTYAAHTRDMTLMEHVRKHVDREVYVHYQGTKYTVIRDADLRVFVIRNTRWIKKPPSVVLEKARLKMSALDVQDVHGF